MKRSLENNFKDTKGQCKQVHLHKTQTTSEPHEDTCINLLNVCNHHQNSSADMFMKLI